VSEFNSLCTSFLEKENTIQNSASKFIKSLHYFFKKKTINVNIASRFNSLCTVHVNKNKRCRVWLTAQKKKSSQELL